MATSKGSVDTRTTSNDVWLQNLNFLDYSTTPFTVMCWHKPNNSTISSTQTAIGNNNQQDLIEVRSSSPSAVLGNNVCAGSATPGGDKWWFQVIFHDSVGAGSTNVYFKDGLGSLSLQFSGLRTPNSLTNDLVFGKLRYDTGVLLYGGLVGCSCFYTQNLTVAQAQEFQHNPYGFVTSNLHAFFPFYDLVDRSTNGYSLTNNGTLDAADSPPVGIYAACNQ